MAFLLDADVVSELRRAAQDPRVVAWHSAHASADAYVSVLPVTAEIAQAWGRLNVPLRPPVIDGLLAATARVHRLTLVTRNVADFAASGVPVVDPFSG